MSLLTITEEPQIAETLKWIEMETKKLLYSGEVSIEVNRKESRSEIDIKALFDRWVVTFCAHLKKCEKGFVSDGDKIGLLVTLKELFFSHNPQHWAVLHITCPPNT